MAKKEFINKSDISDALIERPIGFSIGRKHFSVYPATLGKIQLIARLLEALGLNEKSTSSDVIIKTAQERDVVNRLVAYSTLPGSDCLDEEKVKVRMKELRKANNSDIATIVLVILTNDKTELIMKQFGMDIEAAQLKKVMKVKEDNKNSITFSGKSIWGAIIDAACERYGWSYQYVLWGISYTNLQLILADQIKSVFLTDAERKRVHISTDRKVVRADDANALNEFIKTHNWR